VIHVAGSQEDERQEQADPTDYFLFVGLQVQCLHCVLNASVRIIEINYFHPGSGVSAKSRVPELETRTAACKVLGDCGI
jgi:hypothetical protein